MTRRRSVTVAAWILAIAVLTAGRARALEPDQIALVVNRNVPIGIEAAHYYARRRKIPAGSIITLDLPDADDIPFVTYQQSMVMPIRAFLRKANLSKKVTCLVTLYGVPLRVGARAQGAADKDEIIKLQADLAALQAATFEQVRAFEALVHDNDSSFKPGFSVDFRGLSVRCAVASRALRQALERLPAGAQRDAVTAKANVLLQELIGPVGVLQQRLLDWDLRPPVSPADKASQKDALARLAQIRQQLDTLSDDMESSDSRAKLRALVRDNFGPFECMTVMHDQMMYLGPDDSPSALDSELALLWWNGYPHARWITNPLYYRITPQPGEPSTLMISRLDAPTPAVLSSMIDASIEVEKRGLSGSVVIDCSSSLVHKEKDSGKPGPYTAFDQTLIDLAALLHAKTHLQVDLHQGAAVLPPHSVNGVALYCGWYSVHFYIPSCGFVPGAVGYHVASCELFSLHSAADRGWCRGLLSDGVVGTLGPVAEPYLQSFPRPDDFFPLLLTGRFTLAETYWKTSSTASWMQALVGDPLYNPYKMHPALAPDDLPDRLKPLMAKPATAPAAH